MRLATTGPVIAYKDVADLAEVTTANITDIKAASNKISEVTYERNGKTCTYKDNQYTVK